MKNLALAFLAALAVAVFAVANRPVELSSLENLRALDGADDIFGKQALRWVNENALEHLPVGATLRVEEAFAGIVLATADEPVATAAR